MNTTELTGMRALVTGGASGIGLAIAQMLAQHGAAVACLDLDPTGVTEPLTGIVCDVSDDDSVKSAVLQATSALGGLDIVVNNAGIGAQGTISDTPLPIWERLLDVNVLGAVRVTHAALPHLRRSPHPSVVNIASIAASAGLPARAAYSATKGAIQALTRAMAADHVREGIRVNSVSPGTVNTPWVQRLLAAADDPERELTALKARQPTGTLVQPQEVAAAVCYLASPLAASTTGIDLAVDGGMHGLRMPPRGVTRF
ncbi:SDR family NAD(P)-dependent oxidoreductase [Streptomyces viridochromogenes]|uniref:Putative short chain dehydrogenase n=1 Tax=Streptomyces viridochromogenes Tue57 TaxID=1160705 RepID=L8PQ50_STRVR|nr:SDR family oxidoreductase [Streptomyces viridochromogenes]ELS58229.1 putative short chain dehydrogenase [Streptomyces viridochromogenes Tue57]